MGSSLVLIGLALFMVVFVTLFPVLRDPVGAYDHWFPVEEPADALDAPIQVDRIEPAAAFSWEAVAVESIDPPIYRVRFVDTSRPGEADIVARSWGFGDARGGDGETVVHDYAVFGAYVVTLTIEDALGHSDTVAGEVVVPGVDATAGAAGQINQFANLDVDIGASLEEAVGSVGDDINATLDGAVGSIGRSARGAVVVFLFALAAFAITIVAWRVAKVGVMVLTSEGAGRGGGDHTPPADDQTGRERQLELV